MLRTRPSEITLTAADIEQALGRAHRRKVAAGMKGDKASAGSHRPFAANVPRLRPGPERSRDEAIVPSSLPHLRWQSATPGSAEASVIYPKSDPTHKLRRRVGPDIPKSSQTTTPTPSRKPISTNRSGQLDGGTDPTRQDDRKRPVLHLHGFVGTAGKYGFHETVLQLPPISTPDRPSHAVRSHSVQGHRQDTFGRPRSGVAQVQRPLVVSRASSFSSPNLHALHARANGQGGLWSPRQQNSLPETTVVDAIRRNISSPLDMLEQRATSEISRAPSMASVSNASWSNSLPRRRPPRANHAKGHGARSASATDFSTPPQNSESSWSECTNNISQNNTSSKSSTTTHPLLGRSSPTPALALLSLEDASISTVHAGEFDNPVFDVHEMRSVSQVIRDIHKHERHLIHDQLNSLEPQPSRGNSTQGRNETEPRRVHRRRGGGSFQGEGSRRERDGGRAIMSSPPRPLLGSSPPPLDRNRPQPSPPRSQARRYHRRPPPAIRPQGAPGRPEIPRMPASRAMPRWQQEQENSSAAEEGAMMRELRAREQRPIGVERMDQTPPAIGRFMRHIQ